MAKLQMPDVLYHSSGYLTDTLRPGIYYSGEVMRWDEIESNEYLYATPLRDNCINLGLASSVDKKHFVKEFHTSDNEMTLEFVLDSRALPMTIKGLLLMPVFLYTIQPSPTHKWEPVINKVNEPGTEWKTKNYITGFRKEKIDVRKWLKGRKVIIRHPRTRVIEKVL